MREKSNETSKDFIAIKDNKGNRLFSEEEEKSHAMNYYKELHTKSNSQNYNPQWAYFINSQAKKYLTNYTSNQEEYKKKIYTAWSKSSNESIKKP